MRRWAYSFPVGSEKALGSSDPALHVEKNWHLTGLLHETALKGFYAPCVKNFVQSGTLPTHLLWSLDGRHDLYCGTFDSTGERFFSCAHDGMIRTFDSSGKFLRLMETTRPSYSFFRVVSLELSPNERFFIYAILTGEAHLVSLGDRSVPSRTTHIVDSAGHADVSRTFGACFDGTGMRVVCGHNDAYISVFDLQTQKHNYLKTNSSRQDVNAVTSFDKAGHIILTGGDDTNIRMFDLRALNEGAVAIFVGHMDGITYMDTKGDGCYFLSNSKDQTVRLWDVRKHSKPGKERQLRPRCNWDYRIHSVPRIYGHPRHRTSGSSRGDQSVLTLRGHTVRFTLIRARFSPAHSTGQRYAYAGSIVGGWYIWDLISGELLHNVSRGSQAIRDVCWHPSEPTVITSELNGSLSCWTNHPQSDLPDTLGRPQTTRSQLEQADPNGSRYRHQLEESGLRYRFPDDADSWPSGSSGSPMHYLDDSDDVLAELEPSETTTSDGSIDERIYEEFLEGHEHYTTDEDDLDYWLETETDHTHEPVISLPATRSRRALRRRTGANSGRTSSGRPNANGRLRQSRRTNR